jgi:hypothetical protein
MNISDKITWQELRALRLRTKKKKGKWGARAWCTSFLSADEWDWLMSGRRSLESPPMSYVKPVGTGLRLVFPCWLYNQLERSKARQEASWATGGFSFLQRNATTITTSQYQSIISIVTTAFWSIPQRLCSLRITPVRFFFIRSLLYSRSIERGSSEVSPSPSPSPPLPLFYLDWIAIPLPSQSILSRSFLFHSRLTTR